MATAKQVLDGANRARRAGDAKAYDALYNEYVRLRDEERVVKYGKGIEAPADETGVIGNLLKGAGTGAVGLVESAALGLATSLEEETELKAREKIQSVASAIKPEGGDQDALSYKFGQGLGSIAAFLPTALLGKAALPAAGVLAMGAGSGEASERARDYGATEEQRGTASVQGAFVGATELIPLGRLANKLKVPYLSDGLEKLSKKMGKSDVSTLRGKLQSAAGTGVVEGAQETAAAVLQNLVEQGYNPERLLIDAGVAEEGAIGGSAGATLQVLVDLFAGRRIKKGKEAAAKETKAQEEFEERQETAREARDDVQGDMFADELTTEEDKELDRMQAEEDATNKAERERLEDDDEVQLDLMEAEEKTEQEAKEKAVDEKERAKQIDLVDRIEEEEALDTMQAEEDAAKEKEAAADKKEEEIRKASEVETQSAKRDDEVENKTRTGRRIILDEVFDAAPETGTKEIYSIFKTKLEEAGYRDSTPSKGEQKSIKRFISVSTAKRPKQPDLPSDSDLSTLESRIKEKVNVGEQATRTPDTGTARDSVPSDTEVVGQQRAESAGESGRPVKGGLDDSVSDTGRPARRKGRAKRPLRAAPKKPTAFKESPQEQLTLFGEPAVNETTDKVEYKKADQVIPKHKNVEKDNATLDALSKVTPALEKSLPTDAQPVAKYVRNFSDTKSALVNAIYDVALPNRKDRPKGVTAKQSTKVLRWMRKNISAEGNAAIRKRIKEIREAEKVSTQKQKTTGKTLAQQALDSSKKARQEAAKKAEVDTTVDTTVGTTVDTKPKAKAKAAPKTAPKAAPKTTTAAKPKAKTTTAEPKTSKVQSAADNNVAKVLSSKTADFTDSTTYKNAMDNADKSSDPVGSREAIDARRKKQEADKPLVAEAEQNLAEAKGENVKVLTPKAKLIAEVFAKYESKGVTQEDVILAYNNLGKKGLKDADASLVLEAAEQERMFMDNALTIFDIDKEALEAYNQVLSGTAKEFLDQGDLKGLLRQIAKDIKTPRMKAIVRALEKNMGNTVITTDTGQGIVDRGAKQPPEGEGYAGMFFSGSNSIVINKDATLYVHTILHEATHAATAVFIRENPNNPTVRKLKTLYETMKKEGMLQNTYAADNIYEFVAEAFSNNEFRAQLAATPFDYSNNQVVSAFQKFVNYIRDIFRIFRGDLAQSSGSVLDASDKWIYNILTPTPGDYIHNHAHPLSIAKAVRDITNPIGSRLMAPINAIYNFILDNKPKGSSITALAKVMNLQSLVDLARKVNPKLGEAAYKLLKVIEQQQGLFEQYKRSVDLVLRDLKEFTKKHGDNAKSVLDEIIYNENFGATIYQVDPTKLRSKYVGKTDESGNKLDEIWDAQHRELGKLSPEARRAVLEQFTSMRKLYQKQWKTLRKALGIELDSLAKDGDGAKADAIRSVASKMDRRLFAKQEMEIYFPLVREGKFKLAIDQIITNEDGSTRVEPAFLMFHNIAERDAFIRDIPNNPEVVNNSDRVYEEEIKSNIYSNPPSGSFVAEILDVLDKAEVPTSIQEEILNMYVNALPESSYAKSLQKRLNRLGYIKDAKTALENKGYSLASQSAKLESAAKIRVLESEMKEISSEENDEVVSAVAKVLLLDHARFAAKGANNKGLEGYFKRANQIAFIYTLGLNMSSALVNLSQLPLFVVPMLAPRYGLDKVTAAITKASKMVGSTKASMIELYDINGEGEGATYTLKEDMKEKIRANSATKAEAEARIKELQALEPLIKMAHMRGKLPTADTLQEVGVNEKSNFMDRMGHMSAYFFQLAERFNTQTTLISSYELAIKQMRDKKDAKEFYFSPSRGEEVSVLNLDEAAMQELAAEDALWTTQEVNSGGRLETAPALSKQGIGRVAFMYKTYGIQMYYSMLKSAGIAFNLVFKNYSKEQRKIARQQLYGVHFTALMFAGVGGIPLYGVITMLYDLMAGDDEDTADEMVRKNLGEMGFKGPLSTLTGVDVAARVKLTDLLLQHNRFMRDPSVEESLMHYVGGPAWSTVKRFDRGINDIAKGEYQRALEAMIPTAGAGNALQAIRFYQDEGIATRRGDFIYEDIGHGEIASKFLGFSPTEYTFRTEQNARDQRVSKAVQDKRAEIHREYYLGLRFGDYVRMEDAREEMLKFNAKHPTAALSHLTIIKSMKSHTKTTQTMHNGVTVSPLMQYALDRSREDYNQW